MRKRVVITGLGVVSAVGNSVPEFWSSLIEGKDGTKEITVFDPSPLSDKDRCRGFRSRSRGPLFKKGDSAAFPM